jgi:hypothetical protein
LKTFLLTENIQTLVEIVLPWLKICHHRSKLFLTEVIPSFIRIWTAGIHVDIDSNSAA